MIDLQCFQFSLAAGFISGTKKRPSSSQRQIKDEIIFRGTTFFMPHENVANALFLTENKKHSQKRHLSESLTRMIREVLSGPDSASSSIRTGSDSRLQSYLPTPSPRPPFSRRTVLSGGYLIVLLFFIAFL